MNTETLSFPGLGLSFDIDRVAFTIAGQPIYWYGVIIAAAFLAGALYALRRTKAFGLDSDRVMDVILGGVLLGVIGARLYYVLFSWEDFKDDLLSIINIRQGGIAIYGGIIGAVLAALVVCKWRRVKFLPMCDLATGGLLLGQAIGRWGNFVNMEAFGGNTTAPWGMTSPSIAWYLQQNQASLQAIGVEVDPALPVHPTFFYESVWCLLGFLLILFYTKKRRFDGELSLIYLGWYGLGRFFIEGLRTDSLLVGSIRVSQMLALLCFIGAVLCLGVIHSRIRREGDPEYLMLYVHTDEGKAVLAGEFYKKEETSSKSDEEGSTEEALPDTDENTKTEDHGAVENTATDDEGENDDGEQSEGDDPDSQAD